MRPEAVLMKQVRVALAKDGRVRVVPNFVGLVLSWALVQRAVKARNWSLLEDMQPIHAGLGKGSSDLVGMLRGGRLFCLEVKTARGCLSDEQTLWLAFIRSWGGFAATVRSPDDAIAAVERALTGASE